MMDNEAEIMNNGFARLVGLGLICSPLLAHGQIVISVPAAIETRRYAIEGDYFVLSPGKTPADEYEYEQGRLVKIIKKTRLKNFIIRLLP
jgi:hypothetical protein